MSAPFRGEPPALGPARLQLSIAALGFELASIKDRRRELDDADCESPSARIATQSAARTLRDREHALENAIATMPAENLVEATIQIAIAGDMASILESGDWREPAFHDYLAELHRRIYLITLSVLPVFAAAAKLDEKAMGWEGDFAHLRKHHFFGPECGA